MGEFSRGPRSRRSSLKAKGLQSSQLWNRGPGSELKRNGIWRSFRMNERAQELKEGTPYWVGLNETFEGGSAEIHE